MNSIRTRAEVYAEAKGVSGKPWFRVISAGSDSQSAEIKIIGQIGASWWDDDGVKEKDFLNALAAIPVGRQVTIGINSEGGSVKEGLGIYNAIRARKEDITCRIDGYACSIASVIAVAGKRTISPRTSVWMIHDPWSFCQGNADEMRKAAEMLDTHAHTLVAAYKDKTGKSEEDIRKAMKAETWMSGEDAKAWGLSDETTDSKASLASWQPSSEQRKRMPSGVLNMITAASSESAKTEEEHMNRKAILALLIKHGVKVADDATDEALLAEINKLVEAKTIESRERDELTTRTETPTVDVKAISDRIASIEAENKRLRDERNASLEREADRDVEECVQEGRIPVTAKSSWVKRIIAEGAAALAELRSYAVRAPGDRPLITVGAGAATSEIARALTGIRAPMAAFLRGNTVSAEARVSAAKSMERMISRHRDQLVQAVSTNTIDSDLQRNVILSDMLRAFKRKLIPLRAFSVIYNDVPLRIEGGTAKVAVPYFPLSTTASDDFEPATGYDVEMNTNDGAKDVTIDKRKYQRFSYSSETFSRQPYFNAIQHLALQAEQLGVDVWTQILGLITAANYSGAAVTTPVAAFDSDDVVDLKKVADDADWPEMGRAFGMSTGIENNLLKQPGLVRVDATGSDEALRTGRLGSLFSFSLYPSPRIPSNSENLVGFISMPSSIVCATAPVEPAPGVRNLLVSYDLVIDPDTGIGFTYRHGGNDTLDRDYHIVEVAYGYGVGEAAALKRVVTA